MYAFRIAVRHMNEYVQLQKEAKYDSRAEANQSGLLRARILIIKLQTKPSFIVHTQSKRAKCKTLTRFEVSSFNFLRAFTRLQCFHRAVFFIFHSFLLFYISKRAKNKLKRAKISLHTPHCIDALHYHMDHMVTTCACLYLSVIDVKVG